MEIISEVVPVELLLRLSEKVATELGLEYPPDRVDDMRRGIRAAVPDFGFESELDCVRWLLASQFTPKQIEVLAEHLTIGETYFWREHHTLAAVEEHVLPPLIQLRRNAGLGTLNIWSAACSSGEEPYSLAIMLHRLLPDIKNWKINLQATDINHTFLRKAIAGRYGKWSFRGTPDWIRENYFQRTDDGFYEISPQIRQMVIFSHFNLTLDIETLFPAGTPRFDIIFCRNVLIYMRERAPSIIARLADALNEGGWLVLSPVESSLVQTPVLRAANFPGSVLFQKVNPANSDVVIAKPTAASRPSGLGRGDTNGKRPLYARDVTRSAFLERRKTSAVREQAGKRVVEERRKEPGKQIDATGKLGSDIRELRAEARRFANAGRLEEALALCDQAIQHDRLVAEVYYLRASILQEQGNLVEAHSSLQRAVYLDSNFVLAHFALGNLSVQQGQSREAQLHFANALRLLQTYASDVELPESDGILAGQLREVITSMMDGYK